MRIRAGFSGWHRGLLFQEGQECEVEDEIARELVEGGLAFEGSTGEMGRNVEVTVWPHRHDNDGDRPVEIEEESDGSAE